MAISIFVYTKNELIELPLSQNNVCENACILLCQELSITPTARHLFGLRIATSKFWVPLSKELITSKKYEFRLRFKHPNLSELKQLDRNAYNYYYEQVRHDFVRDKIPEIEYVKQEKKINGLIVTDMFKDMIEKKVNIDYLKKNYKSYSPKVIVDRHPFFLRKNIIHNVRQIKNYNYDAE